VHCDHSDSYCSTSVTRSTTFVFVPGFCLGWLRVVCPELSSP
jgi:hypothetical protein